ncbi:MAG: EVE domain-containing protein, partial [Planctomycetes bacterium]|nr:EVE domain-containing protein [Planctomycetota bacterium]
IARVTKEAYQDPPTDNDAWICVDIKPVKKLKTPVHLSDIKGDKLLSQMALVKNSRLSVCPVSKKEWDKAVKAGGA